MRKTIYYKNHAIIFDGSMVKIYDKNDRLVDKTTYIFFNQMDILKRSKDIINSNQLKNRTIDIYA